MSDLSWAAVKRLVYARANGCCEYCRTCEENTGQPMHIEHIDPAGGDDAANLCLACSHCNLTKGKATTGYDATIDETISLFHPRNNVWHEHFAWTEGGMRIVGLTAIGRVTLERLKMNHVRLIRARRNWIIAGSHPPA